ncbi:MAG: FkbM family methyltransferase [PVC group bacterium]|nr:FkbM family methyltransferase [PVC group bacterium]
MNIFIDCGAYNGDSIRKFREKIDYENNKDSWRFYAFEPNPYVDIELENVIIIKKAVWTEDCKKKLYFSKRSKKDNVTTLMENKTTPHLNFKDYAEVECVDLSSWLYRNIDLDDHVVLKMDIEGAEYNVLAWMGYTDVLALINELYCEFHVKKLKMDPQIHLDLIRSLKGETLTLHGDLIPSVKHPEFADIEAYVKLGERLLRKYRREA